MVVGNFEFTQKWELRIKTTIVKTQSRTLQYMIAYNYSFIVTGYSLVINNKFLNVTGNC